jgi:hypothetical protein
MEKSKAREAVRVMHSEASLRVISNLTLFDLYFVEVLESFKQRNIHSEVWFAVFVGILRILFSETSKPTLFSIYSSGILQWAAEIWHRVLIGLPRTRLTIASNLTLLSIYSSKTYFPVHPHHRMQTVARVMKKGSLALVVLQKLFASCIRKLGALFQSDYELRLMFFSRMTDCI